MQRIHDSYTGNNFSKDHSFNETLCTTMPAKHQGIIQEISPGNPIFSSEKKNSDIHNS
jgi:hypothetical protein